MDGTGRLSLSNMSQYSHEWNSNCRWKRFVIGLKNHANDLVHSQSEISSAQVENGQAHRISSESTGRPEIGTLILKYDPLRRQFYV